MPADWRFILMTSGIEAAKAGAARGRYNRASLATQALTDVWRRHTGDARARTLAGILNSDPGALSALQSGLDLHAHPDFPADELARRLVHFVAEDGRVLPAVEAFAQGDRSRLGELSARSQAEAEGLLGNQVRETTALAALARESGAFAASSFGAGFGGSVWALADADRAAEVASRWRAAYVARFPGLDNVNALIVRPSAPALAFDMTEWKFES